MGDIGEYIIVATSVPFEANLMSRAAQAHLCMLSGSAIHAGQFGTETSTPLGTSPLCFGG